MAAVIAVAERVIADTFSGRCRMNEPTAAYINTNMADLGTAAGLGEEDQIADIQIRLSDMNRIGILAGRRAA